LQKINITTMNAHKILEKLWDMYITDNPSVEKVYNSFIEAGEHVVNDHIAFRTFDIPEIDIDVLAGPFLKSGYELKGEYHFEKKKLFAKHFEHPTDKSLPLVFISQLLTASFSPQLNAVVRDCVAAIPKDLLQSDDLIYSGVVWDKPSKEVYFRLMEESEYAAWVYMSGFRANHFTVRVNNLRHLQTVEEVNEFLKQKGFRINNSGGEVKGNQELYLEQSSIVSEEIEVDFQEGKTKVPGCFYEFAKRYTLPDGNLFMGFVADSADKIFESTNFQVQS